MCQTSCKLHSLRLLDAQLSRGGGPVIAAPVRAESELPNAAAAPNTTGAPKAKKSACGTTEPIQDPPARQGRQKHEAMARQRQTGSYTWTQVKSVQNLIERCLSQYMTQAEVIATLQVQADVDPALTCLVWSKLEEANPDFFLSYDVRLKLKDQIVAFNYLVEQQTRLLQKLTLALPQQGLMD